MATQLSTRRCHWDAKGGRRLLVSVGTDIGYWILILLFSCQSRGARERESARWVLLKLIIYLKVDWLDSFSRNVSSPRIALSQPYHTNMDTLAPPAAEISVLGLKFLILIVRGLYSIGWFQNRIFSQVGLPHVLCSFVSSFAGIYNRRCFSLPPSILI